METNSTTQGHSFKLKKNQVQYKSQAALLWVSRGGYMEQSPSFSVLHRKIRYNLSSDEKEQIAKTEREKRRKIRLLQVREISRKNAATIRNAVRHEKLKQLQKLADNISNEFHKSKEQQLKELEANYENSLRNIGRAHTNASKPMEDEDTKERFKRENKLKAAYRHNAALERLHDDQVRKYVHDNKHIISRKAALEKEKERATQIASLPKPSPGILQDVLQNVCPVSVRNENMNQDEIYFPVTTIVKRHHNESVEDGRRAAMIQEEKLDEQFHHARSLAVEREQVAKIRFKKAIDKELLNRDSEKVIKELSFLQKKQMKKRQKQLATIPKQVFLPPYKRTEALQDKQRLMEEEFEQFYVGDQMALKSDLSVLLEPHPPVETPCQSDSLDLTLTSDIEASPARNLPNQSSIMKDITNVSLPATQTATTKRQTLQTLFDRIKSQRDGWISDMAENLQDTEVTSGRNKTSEPGAPSHMPSPTESREKCETEISDSLTEILNALETDERPLGSPLNETSSATMPVANVVQKMEQIQKHLQQISLTEEDIQQEVLAKPEEAKDMANGDPASFQPAAIASHLKKQIAEVLEQKKRIQEQRNQLEERLQQFDQHQNKTSLGGYIFNPPGFPRPSRDLLQGLVHSPVDDNSVGHSKDETEDVPDTKILNSGLNLASLSNSDTEMDLRNQMLDQQSPDYLANEALKRLPKDIAKIQHYQQNIIQQHTERIKRIEEIQMDIQQHRKTLQDSISGISLAEAIPKSDPAPSRMITTDLPTIVPLESTTKQTNDISNIYDVPVSPQSNALLTGFYPSVPFLSDVEHKILPNWNQSKDQILGSDFYGPYGLSQKGTDFLPAYQSCIQESIAGNLFGSDFHESVFSMDFQESNTVKETCPASPLDCSTQHFQPENLSVETRPSEPNTPDLDITSKIYNSYAFTPSFDLDSFPAEPIPSSELQEIRKSLPFDETLEDSAQPTPVPSQTVSPHKKSFPSYNDSVISETRDSDVPDAAVPLPSNTTDNQGEFLRIQKQLEEVRKKKEKLCQRLMDNQFEQQAKALKSFKQETLPSGLDISDHMPLATELSEPPKKHPPLLPMAYLYGHSPHELSAIQEKDSSILSSYLSDMHSKLSMSSSICSSSEPTQTNLDPLISGQQLEDKKLWNILKILNHENLGSSNDISQSGSKATRSSFATSSPLLSEINDFDPNVQPHPAITVSRGNLSAQPQKSNVNEVPQPPTSSKTWAQVLLEMSQEREESESDIETSPSILQEVPNSTYNFQIALPISTDTDSTVLRNVCFDATGTQSIGPKAVLALSSSLGSLQCEPMSAETSSDESRLVPCGHTRDSSSPSTQAQDSSEGSSLANTEFPSMNSLTKDLLQNHEELSEFLSRILQTSKKFRSQTLQQSPQDLPLDTTVQTLPNSTEISPSPHFSSTVSLSPGYHNQRDSALALYPSTLSDTSVSAGGGELTSSALFQLTNTANQSVMGNGPTLCAWSPSTVDNIANTTSTSLVDADSKTNSSDVSLISVIPQTSTAGNQVMVSSSTVDIGKPLTQSSPSQISASSPLPSRPTCQTNTIMSSTITEMGNLNSDGLSETRFSSVCYPPKEASSCYKAATVSVSQEQIRDEIMHTSSSQAFILPSTPNLLLKSHPHPLPQLSSPSELSHSPYVSPISHDTANLSHSILAGVISPNPQTTSTSSSPLTQYSIHTTQESDNNVDISPSSNAQDYLTQQVRNIPSSSPGYSLSSYYSVSVSEGTAPSFTMKAMAGVELSKVAENLLPSVATVIAALSSSSSSSSSPSFVVSGPSTLLQYQPTDQNQIRTKESPSSPGTPSPPSSSCQMECTIQTHNFLSLKVSSQMSSSIPSASPPDNKDTSKLDLSKVPEPLPQIKSAPILPVIHDQYQSNKSSSASSGNLSLTQYSYTSPETCNDETLPRPSQINPLTSPGPSNPPYHQLPQKLAANVQEKLSNSVVQAISSWQNSEPLGTNPGIWRSLAQDVFMKQSSSESESFKYAKSLSGSCSSHSGKQSSPEVELQTKEKSSTDDSSKDESPSFVPLMYNRNTSSSDSSDTTPEKVLPAQESFQATLDVDGTSVSAAEVTNLMAGVSSPPELTDSHYSSKMVSPADLSSLSGLSQLSLPSDMMEDYQHLIQQARTLVKRCKANLQQENKDTAYASGDSGLQSGMALTSSQALFSEADPLAKERGLSSGDNKCGGATNRGTTEMTEANLILFDQISDLNQLGISDKPNWGLVSSGNDSPTVQKGGQPDKVPWVDTARTDGYLTENKEEVTVNPQRLDTSSQSRMRPDTSSQSRMRPDTSSQSRMRPDQTISNSVAAWKLKYSLGPQTKK